MRNRLVQESGARKASFRSPKSSRRPSTFPTTLSSVNVASDSPESDPKNDIVADLIVRMHGSVVEVNQKLAKQAKKYNFITPRDFLDFIRHFVDLLAEKKEELQEQQYHLSIGLDKLRDTEQQVKELQS